MIKPALYLFDPDQTHDLLWAEKINGNIANLLSNALQNHGLFDGSLPIALIDRHIPGGDHLPWAIAWSTVYFEFLKELSRTHLLTNGEINGSAYGFTPEYQADLPEELNLGAVFPDTVKVKFAKGTTGSVTWLERSHSETKSGQYCPQVSNNIQVWMRRGRVVTAPKDKDVVIELDSRLWLHNSVVFQSASFEGLPDAQRKLLDYAELDDRLENIWGQFNISACNVLTGMDWIFPEYTIRSLWYDNFKVFSNPSLGNPLFQSVPSWYYFSALVYAVPPERDNRPLLTTESLREDLGKKVTVEFYGTVDNLSAVIRIQGNDGNVIYPYDSRGIPRSNGDRVTIEDYYGYSGPIYTAQFQTSFNFLYYSKSHQQYYGLRLRGGRSSLGGSLLRSFSPSLGDVELYATRLNFIDWIADNPNLFKERSGGLVGGTRRYDFTVPSGNDVLESEILAIQVDYFKVTFEESDNAINAIITFEEQFSIEETQWSALQAEEPIFGAWSYSFGTVIPARRTFRDSAPIPKAFVFDGEVINEATGKELLAVFVANVVDPNPDPLQNYNTDLQPNNPNNIDHIGDIMPDSLRIKEIHAALQADKYANDDKDATKARVTNLGWLIDKMSNILGLHFASDGAMLKVRNTEHKKDGDTIPEQWQVGQWGKNNWIAEDGTVVNGVGYAYEVRSNGFATNKFTGEATAIEEGGWVLCNSLIQLLEVKYDDDDRAFGLQDMGANVIPKSDRLGYIKYEGMHGLLVEIAYMLSSMSGNITRSEVLDMKSVAILQELMYAQGLPVTLKTMPAKVAGIDVNIPYPGFEESAPSLVDFMFWILTNLSPLVAGNLAIKSAPEEETV